MTGPRPSKIKGKCFEFIGFAFRIIESVPSAANQSTFGTSYVSRTMLLCLHVEVYWTCFRRIGFLHNRTLNFSSFANYLLTPSFKFEYHVDKIYY